MTRYFLTASLMLATCAALACTPRAGGDPLLGTHPGAGAGSGSGGGAGVGMGYGAGRASSPRVEKELKLDANGNIIESEESETADDIFGEFGEDPAFDSGTRARTLSATESAAGKRVICWKHGDEQTFDARAFNVNSKDFIAALRDALNDPLSGISTFNAGYEAPKLGLGVKMSGPYSQTWEIYLEAVIDPFDNTGVIQIDSCSSTGPDGRPSQRRQSELDNLLRDVLIPKLTEIAARPDYQIALSD